MKLIREEIEQVEVIVESRNGKKNLFIEGVFLQGEIKNRNGRMYPMNTLAREVGRYNENFVQKGRALGELGHTDGPTVNLDRVSHKIVSLKESGNNFINYSFWVILVSFLCALISITFWTFVGKFFRRFATNEKFIKVFNYVMSSLLLACIATFYL